MPWEPLEHIGTMVLAIFGLNLQGFTATNIAVWCIWETRFVSCENWGRSEAQRTAFVAVSCCVSRNGVHSAKSSKIYGSIVLMLTNWSFNIFNGVYQGISIPSIPPLGSLGHSLAESFEIPRSDMRTSHWNQPLTARWSWWSREGRPGWQVGLVLKVGTLW